MRDRSAPGTLDLATGGLLLGYARVSTDAQDLTNQREQLAAVGCSRIFAEKVTGTRRDRPELARLLDHLRPGDVVTVTRLDRLARSTRDLLDIAERIQAAGAGLRSPASSPGVSARTAGVPAPGRPARRASSPARHRAGPPGFAAGSAFDTAAAAGHSPGLRHQGMPDLLVDGHVKMTHLGHRN